MDGKVDICNQALAFLGMRSIASLDERTPEAAECRRFYETVLCQVLRDHPWNFAERRERLALTPVPEEWSREYPLAYACPVHCLELLYLVDASGLKHKRFRLASDGRRRIIFTHIPKAIAAYTAKEDDPGRYDPLFSEALVRRLQACLVKPLLKNAPSLVKEAEDLYQRALLKAKAADAREGERLLDGDAHWNGGHANPWIRERLHCFGRH